MPAGPFRGTLAYAAPEVARGEPFGAPADVFALAASFLHATCGAPPRTTADSAVMLLAAGDCPIDAWAQQAARALPPPLARTLVRCCAFDANERPGLPLVWREPTRAG